jgi:retron-type reverse transcriptase
VPVNSQDDFMSRFIAAAIAGAVGVAALIAQAIWKRKKLRQSQELLKRGAQYPPLAPPARQKGELTKPKPLSSSTAIRPPGAGPRQAAPFDAPSASPGAFIPRDTNEGKVLPANHVFKEPELYKAPGGTPLPGVAISGAPSGAMSVPVTPPPSAQPKSNTSLKLDAGLFKPISDAEAKRQAAGTSLWGNPFFGRRDLIPPVTDQRTLVIDRAMVGHGLITPEELDAIHRIGEAMDRVRPDLAQVQVVADKAVEQAREERRRLKEQKKAEAAERKRLHAEAVARRKQTDIIFLGRGVSKGLADRKSDEAKLTAAGLPVLSTPADVASALNLPISRLRWLGFHSDAATVTHYVRFTVPKKGGGVRNLAAPRESLANAQQWILKNILEKIPTHPAAHGFVIGRSTVTNATKHVGKAVVANADLRDFFPTITFPRVLGIFRQVGYSPAVSTVLALLCTEAPRRTIVYAGKPFHVAAGPRALPQGACTSPALSNLASRRLDSRLTGIASKLGWTYTRYADDITLSAPADAAKDRIGYLLARLRHIAGDEGFVVNEKKTRILRRSTAQDVTGIVVNDRPGVPRESVRRLRAILHRAKTEGLEAQNHQRIPHFRAWLTGMIAYVSMVNPQQGKALAKAMAALPLH